MNPPSTRVCVYCGSRPGGNPAYTAAARALGSELARRDIGLVYGGGRSGMMGALADAALAAGGEVIGVIPHALLERDLAHNNLSKLIVVDDMPQRKAQMAEHAQALIALPGGFGTFEELGEALSWAQLDLHSKAIFLFNIDSYFDSLLAFFDRAVTADFLRPEHRSLLRVATELDALFAELTKSDII